LTLPNYRDTFAKRFQPDSSEYASGYTKNRATIDKEHKASVEQAIKESKPVPRNVLEEYKAEPWAQEARKKAAGRTVKESLTVEKGKAEAQKAQAEGAKQQAEALGLTQKEQIELSRLNALKDDRSKPFTVRQQNRLNKLAAKAERAFDEQLRQATEKDYRAGLANPGGHTSVHEGIARDGKNAGHSQIEVFNDLLNAGISRDDAIIAVKFAWPDFEAAAPGEGEKAESPARDILGGVEPIQKINKALREAKSIRPKLEAERKAEKKRRVGRAIGALASSIKKGKGAEQSIFSSTGLLKGPLSDQRYESIRPIMEEAMPGSVDNAFKSIYENKDLQYFEVLDTADAFRKLIDGEPITLREVDLIKKHFGAEMAEIAEARAEVSPWIDKLITLWKAGLLTGAKTSGLNMSSNYTHGITETMKDAPAALIDSVLALFTKERTIAFTTRGFKGGVEEGLQKGWDYLKTGVDERHIGEKLDYHRVKFGNSKLAQALQTYEETIFHLLGAEDQPFYYGAKAHSIYSQAIVAGKNRKLKGKELSDYIDEVVQFPSDEILENATHDAEMAVFQNRTSLGDLARQIQKSKIGEMIVPFGRTPSAVAMQIVNYTPVGVVKEVIEQIHNKKFDQRKFAQAFGRTAVGTGALAAGAALFTAGMMTLDYPDNERERKLWELEGKKPNSIKIGDKWRSVYVLGPVGNVLTIGGYFQEALDESGSPTKAIHTALAGGAKSFSEQTFVSGVNRAVEAIQDPERSFENFFSSIAGSVVPTIVADAARATDYTERRTQGAGERIASRVPGWRETLEPRLDVFGQDVPRYGGNPLEVMLDATRPAKIRHDVVVDEIRRLWDADVRVAPTQLGTRDGYKILTDEENTVLWRRAGQLTYRALFDLIRQPYYKTLNDEAKGKNIESEVKKAKDLARAEAAKIKINQGKTQEELRADGLVTNDVARLISQFEIARK